MVYLHQYITYLVNIIHFQVSWWPSRKFFEHRDGNCQWCTFLFDNKLLNADWKRTSWTSHNTCVRSNQSWRAEYRSHPLGYREESIRKLRRPTQNNCFRLCARTGLSGTTTTIRMTPPLPLRINLICDQSHIGILSQYYKSFDNLYHYQFLIVLVNYINTCNWSHGMVSFRFSSLVFIFGSNTETYMWIHYKHTHIALGLPHWRNISWVRQHGDLPTRSEIMCSGRSEHFLSHPSWFNQNSWKPVICHIRWTNPSVYVTQRCQICIQGLHDDYRNS